MRELLYDDKWKRTGISIIWDIDRLNLSSSYSDIISIYQLFSYLRTGWPDKLPCFDDNAIIVSGLDNLMEVLPPDETINWMEQNLYPLLLSFQKEYQGQAALIFLLPNANGRIKYVSSEDTFIWLCNNQYKNKSIPISKCLWNGAERDARFIAVDIEKKASDLSGIGIYHPRIS